MSLGQYGLMMRDSRHKHRAAPIINNEKAQQLQRRVWAELAEKLEKVQPGLMQNIRDVVYTNGRGEGV